MDIKQLEIDKQKLLRYAGYRAGGENYPEDEELDLVIKHCVEIARPAYRSAYYDYDPERKCLGALEAADVACGKRYHLQGEKVQKIFENARGGIIIGVTLGMGVDIEKKRLGLRSLYDAMMFDAAASVYVETVYEAYRAELKGEYEAKGYRVGASIFPGFSDFPLDFQRDIEEILGLQKNLGITLSDANLMIPAKSMTVLVALL